MSTTAPTQGTSMTKSSLNPMTTLPEGTEENQSQGTWVEDGDMTLEARLGTRKQTKLTYPSFRRVLDCRRYGYAIRHEVYLSLHLYGKDSQCMYDPRNRGPRAFAMVCNQGYW